MQNIQQGAALRIRTNSDQSVDAITVEVNIWYGPVTDATHAEFAVDDEHQPTVVRS